jgi:hypothetical protein
LIGAETGIKTIAAVHSQCRSWVISGQTSASRKRPLSALVRKRTKCCGAANVRYVPLAAMGSRAEPFIRRVCARRECRSDKYFLNTSDAAEPAPTNRIFEPIVAPE